MIKRIVFTSILAAQFLTISAMRDSNSLPSQGSDTGTSLLTRADDPFPCPNCSPGSGQGPSLALMRADDPFPCPNCSPGSGQGPSRA